MPKAKGKNVKLNPKKPEAITSLPSDDSKGVVNREEQKLNLETEKIAEKNFIEADHDSEDSVPSSSHYESSYDAQDKLYDLVKCNTQSFMQTFSEIKNSAAMKTGPLSKYDTEEIKRAIKTGREKLMQERKDKEARQKQERKMSILQKRTNALRQDKELQGNCQKRIKRSNIQTDGQGTQFQALFFISNINLFSKDSQTQILNEIETFISGTPDLKAEAQKLMVKQYASSANSFHESGDVKAMLDLLKSLPSQVAILINIEISLTNKNYMYESSTLSQTLLPFINDVTDYSFLKSEHHFIMSLFIERLTDHIIDKQSRIKQGFIIASLKFESTRIIEIISFQTNKECLHSALSNMRLGQNLTNIITNNYKKLLWPSILDALQGKFDTLAQETLEVLVRVNIISDPGSYFLKLLGYFSQRQLIASQMIEHELIKIPIQVLLRVIESLIQQPKEMIVKTLAEDSAKWEKITIQTNNKGNYINPELDKGHELKMYEEMTKDLEQKVTIETMEKLSKDLSDKIIQYQHCTYQCTIAAVIVSHSDPFLIVISPTGSGKTWIQGLVAKYFCDQRRSVTIIEPNDQLKKQTFDKLGFVDHMITVITLQEFYSYGTPDEIVLVNEYDMIVDEMPYATRENSLTGIWSLKGKNVVAFSATSSIIYERIIHNCIVKPRILSFKSEYEVIKGITPIQEPVLINCKDPSDMEREIELSIESYYEKKPIIIIHDKEQLDSIERLMKANNYSFFKDCSMTTLEWIKTQDRGIILLRSSQCRGLDVRFKTDSAVLILAKVRNQNELLQMVGRSSRTRGVCDSVLFHIGNEKASELMARLNREGITELLELEKLIKLCEKKANDSALVAAVKESVKNHLDLRSIEHLKELMKPAQFSKLIK